MPQNFKSLYYPDHPAKEPKKKNIKIAFGEKDRKLYDSVAGLSSDELRCLIGHTSYTSLRDSAIQIDLPLNTYCIRTLRNKVALEQKNKRFTVDPIQSTFRGGGAEPLHNWYPFLEGYSPRFVETIYKTFCDDAKNVYDPFAGTGTTPLTVAGLGSAALYSEINPLLQFLIEAKIKALTLSFKQRIKLAESLKNIKSDLPDLLAEAYKDPDIETNYLATFGKSKFFDNQTFNSVLRARTVIDDIACSDPIAAQFSTIAILSSLIPASLLKRAGDLRYKTSVELKKEKTDFEHAINQNLTQIIVDLERLASLDVTPTFLCEDAKKIGELPELNIDAVITSPPYLNGTNYFRNTKIELWFLKCLKQNPDLADYRSRAVTAGINDVSLTKEVINSEAIADVVKRLEVKAYDARIPKMVSSYFSDMTVLFDGLRKHLAKNAPLAIDIGDSVYCGIHVPTHELLKKILLSLDYEFENEIILRRRLSRDKTPLHQFLLLFKYRGPVRKNGGCHNGNHIWEKTWRAFKKTLPHQKQPFAKRNWGHPLHSLCSYQGKMKPSLAHFLIKTFLPSESRILDPFAGVGTIPFEASLMGHTSYAFEISPAARIITEAKLKKTDKEECKDTLKALDKFIKNDDVNPDDWTSIQSINFNKSIKEYFHEDTLGEILLARGFFRRYPPQTASQFLVHAALLHILHGNRPYALSRRSHPITPFAPTGNFEYRALLPRLEEKVTRALEAGHSSTFKDGHVFFQDALSWWPREVNNLDAVITSPPFFDSTRFHLGNWMRLWFCGWDKEDFQSKPLSFVDEKQKNSFSIYESIFRQSRERLKKNGLVVLHLGMSKKCDMASELSQIAKKWFRTADLFSEQVTQCESHGIRDKGTVTAHQFLILQ